MGKMIKGIAGKLGGQGGAGAVSPGAAPVQVDNVGRTMMDKFSLGPQPNFRDLAPQANPQLDALGRAAGKQESKFRQGLKGFGAGLQNRKIRLSIR